jgi:hypothetical protein
VRQLENNMPKGLCKPVRPKKIASIPHDLPADPWLILEKAVVRRLNGLMMIKQILNEHLVPYYAGG